MKLVIAEKPSVGMAYAAVLGAKKRMDGYMEDDAIMDAFSHLHDGTEFDRLYDAALCRAKADWLVGINATRLFSVLYHRTLNVGRVVSPTLALIVHRDAEIRAFQPERYYTVSLTFPNFAAVSEKFKDKADADAALAACKDQNAVVTRLDRKEKREKAPALYDLTTLQRDANRLLGYTAQQTLDYLQALYEKKLCTYPRTDSRFLTDDMLSSVPAIVSCAGGICGANLPVSMHPAQVCNSKKVSDHHALLPTVRAGEADLDALPIGEREVLQLLCRQVLIAVSGESVCADEAAEITCGGYIFTAKGKTVLDAGWKAYLNQPEDKPLPDLVEGAALPVPIGEVTEGRTKPPAAYSEDTLLHAMEMPDIVAPKQLDAVSYPHDDSAKTQSENYLKNAEMAMEDDYGMIDGIINNGPKQTVAEQEERSSILAKLKAPTEPVNRTEKHAPKRSAEKEL